MDHTTADIASIDLPADDGDIRTALADLEQRVVKYHSAVRQFHERLPQRAQVPAQEPPVPSAKPSPAKAAPTVPKSEKKADTVPVPRVSASATTPAAPPPASPAANAATSDETLLASLDSETAQAIRVMRRLSPIKKSVQELLAEYKAAQAAAPTVKEEKKKSWFTRGR